jgi:hypothetical protein
MTLKRLRHSDIADVLHLAKVKESELLSVLLSFFNRAKWLSHSVQRFHKEDTNSHVDVTFDDEGKTPTKSQVEPYMPALEVPFNQIERCMNSLPYLPQLQSGVASGG